MPSSFALIFRVAFEHAYFPDGVLRAVRIVPVAACHDMLKRAGMQLRAHDDGIAAHGDGDVLKRLRLHMAETGGPLALAFQVFFTDPQFAGFTAPGWPAGHVLFLDTAATTPDGAGRQMLHATPGVPASAFRDRQDAAIVRILGARVQAPAPAMVLQVTVSEALLDAATPAQRHYHVRFDAARRDDRPGPAAVGSEAYDPFPRAGFSDRRERERFTAQRDLPAWEMALALF